MKTIIYLNLALALMILTSCQEDTSFSAQSDEEIFSMENRIKELQDSILKINNQFSEIYSDFDNKRFLKQKEQKDEYKVDTNLPKESLCEKPDFKGIEEYQGELGPSRQFVQRHARPVGAICIDTRQNSLNKFCSGTLISQNLFLTANHCIDLNITNRFVAFNYEIDINNRLKTIDFYKIKSIKEQGYINNVDYAILELEGNPGNTYGFTQLSDRVLSPGEELTIIQHPDGRPKEIEAGPFKRSFDRWIQYTDLDTEGGSSGSGVLDANGNIVGVHTNGGCDAYSSDGANHGMNIETIMKFSPVIRNLINPAQ